MTTPPDKVEQVQAAMDWLAWIAGDKPEVRTIRDRIAALQAEVARHKEYAADTAAAKLAAELAQRRTEAEAARLREDAARLDWLERAGDVYFGIVVDAPHDGEYSLHHDLAGQPAFGPTLRAAIDAAMGSANGQGDGNA